MFFKQIKRKNTGLLILAIIVLGFLFIGSNAAEKITRVPAPELLTAQILSEQFLADPPKSQLFEFGFRPSDVEGRQIPTYHADVFGSGNFDIPMLGFDFNIITGDVYNMQSPLAIRIDKEDIGLRRDEDDRTKYFVLVPTEVLTSLGLDFTQKQIFSIYAFEKGLGRSEAVRITYIPNELLKLAEEESLGSIKEKQPTGALAPMRVESEKPKAKTIVGLFLQKVVFKVRSFFKNAFEFLFRRDGRDKTQQLRGIGEDESETVFQ